MSGSRFVDPFRPQARAGDLGRTPAATPEPPTPQPAAGETRDPERMNKPELVTWARELGLSPSGTKAELVARIRAAV